MKATYIILLGYILLAEPASAQKNYIYLMDSVQLLRQYGQIDSAKASKLWISYFESDLVQRRPKIKIIDSLKTLLAEKKVSEDSVDEYFDWLSYQEDLEDLYAKWRKRVMERRLKLLYNKK